MGVPKFFCYISERYPCLSELVREFQVPDFDNLYLDMNGIIHACSHPQDADPTFSIQEETIFASIFHYIEVLFNMIKPKKLFFLAVDGVAPRAKMNQQRARRFRSAKDAEVLQKKILNENIESPKERFDSNCITPGTVFMDRLHSFLKYFISNKISTDSLWQECKIILSGHQTPGEGEHKIMDYIRYMKTLPDYDPNTRHCLYGLDADLVMLGLCTHEPHFSLLREKIQFGNKIRKKMMSPDETEFYLLNLSLMREYIDLEFQELKSILPFGFNLENIIDDWVLMGFLVGNDFIPHLPGLHINKGALPMLYKTYKEVLPTLDGYLNENGYLNLARFQAYMEKLGEHDIKVFEETYANLAFLEGKMGKVEVEEVKPKDDVSKKSDLEELIKATNELFLDDDVEEEEFLEDDSETFFLEFRQHKKDYYTNKLDYSNVTEEVLKSQAEGYIRAIQWNLHYYYQGCQSWSWYYPHHYAPYISDIKNFKDLKLDFEMGKPFLPFEQLLAVLPAASKHLLPSVYESLMTSPVSPIKDFYPENFQTDLNGKTQEWEAVVLIPFIDEPGNPRTFSSPKPLGNWWHIPTLQQYRLFMNQTTNNPKRLLEAMKPYNNKLTADERRRNSHGPMHVFTYTEQNLGIYKCEKYFPSIASNHASVVDVDIKDISVDKSNLKFGLRPGVLLDVYFPGFPTFKHIPYTASLKECKLKVFSWPAKGDNMIITVQKRTFPPLQQVAKDFLGNIVYVNWPHLVESRVNAVSDINVKYTLSADGEIEKTALNKEERSIFDEDCSAVGEHYFRRLGIELGNIEVLVYAAAKEGYRYGSNDSGKVALEKVWSPNPSPHPLQVVMKDIKICEQRTRSESEYQDVFPVGSKVFMLGQPHFGSMGTVLDSSECLKNGRVKVSFDIASDPIISDNIINAESKSIYLPCRLAATKVGVTPKVLAHITGCIFIITSDGSKMTDFNTLKVNIGLNLKHNFRNEELPGYTKKENDIWLYSMKAVNLACSYVETFPHVIEYLSEHQNRNDFLMQDLFPGSEGATELLKVITWIKQQDFNNIMPIKVGSKVLESKTVSKISNLVDKFTPEVVTRVMQVKPRLLYKSDLVSGNLPPVAGAQHELFDRVISIRSSYTVPAGLKGFIIGKHIANVESEIIYDVVFDKPFLGGSTVGSAREKVFHMLRNSFVNLSDARRNDQKAVVNLKPASVSLEPQVKMMPPAPKPIVPPAQKPLIPMPPKPVPEDPLQSSTSAFLRWIEEETQAKVKTSSPEKRNDDHFKELWQNLQSPKPSEETDVLKKMLKIGDEKGKSPVIEEPVKSFFEKVSTSTKNAPPKNNQNGIKNGILSIIQSDNQPLNRYCVQLLSFYQRKYLGHPRYNYTYLGNKIIAHIQMRDGRVFSGLPCDEKVSASESAALHALVSLGQISLNGGEELIRKESENQVPPNGNMPARTPVNAPMNPPMNAPMKPPMNPPMNAPMKPPMNPQMNAPMKPPMNPLMNIPVNMPPNMCSKENYHQGNPPARVEVENNWREENRNLSQRQHGGNNNLPFPIPPPPSQWVGPNRNVIGARDPYYQPAPWNAGFLRGPPNRLYEPPPRPPNTGSRVQADALGFVPLQAITGTRNVGVIPPHRNSRAKTPLQPAVSKPDASTTNLQSFQGSSSKPHKPRRRPRIAANLALDQNLY